MKKTLTALAMVGTLAVAAIATSSDADAQWRRGRGAGIGLGIVGGLAAGAIIGGAIANSGPAYGYGAYAPIGGYAPYEGYRVAGPVACPGGYWARKPLVDGYGNVVGYSRPRFFCPAY
jgi:hypothetical protein